MAPGSSGVNVTLEPRELASLDDHGEPPNPGLLLVGAISSTREGLREGREVVQKGC